MDPRSREKQCGADGQGNAWTIFTTMYDSTTGSPGDYDVVVQVQKNGREEGHVTYHYAANRKLKMKPRVHGNPNTPHDFRQRPC